MDRMSDDLCQKRFRKPSNKMLENIVNEFDRQMRKKSKQSVNKSKQISTQNDLIQNSNKDSINKKLVESN
jgi:hypothetical protein